MSSPTCYMFACINAIMSFQLYHTVDTRTPLCHFPFFGFRLLGTVEFEDVQRLANGYVEHPPKFFYTGSLWKYGSSLFFFVHIYIDPRDKVTARHRLICPSKREVMLFGDFKLRGTLLTKAPKGWG
uniref:Uncharacterized protein n=1 Tax=Brassica oleracea TaxID=3712 RepID=A0A3P6CGF8_BRAOL|nr:unnamed protein product [Brassica oleracea]